MGIIQIDLSIRTSKKIDFIDVTDLVQRTVAESGVKKGLCSLFVPHTTAGLTANEHFDPNVPFDIGQSLDRVAPENEKWAHPEGNAPAHVKASLVSASLSVPVTSGELALGRWQGVYLMEFDGPRTRRLLVTIIG